MGYAVSSTDGRFVVTGRADGSKIEWPIRELRLRPPYLGNQSVTPEQLAALVVQRSGVPLTVRAET